MKWPCAVVRQITRISADVYQCLWNISYYLSLTFNTDFDNKKHHEKMIKLRPQVIYLFSLSIGRKPFWFFFNFWFIRYGFTLCSLRGCASWVCSLFWSAQHGQELILSEKRSSERLLTRTHSTQGSILDAVSCWVCWCLEGEGGATARAEEVPHSTLFTQH